MTNPTVPSDRPDSGAAITAGSSTEMPMVARGAEVIRATAKRLADAPGVYRMLNARSDVLYVGKARSLKKRVMQYTQVTRLNNRLRRMVAETTVMEVTQTHTEVEALLLESNLIKRYRPRFNISLRDDKSFPFILLTGDHAFPRIMKYRGSRSTEGDYFGPFASAGLVERTITALQRAFLLRNCSDAVFNARTRPCLQYHIKRCSAPCVGYVSTAEYAEQVRLTREFLAGRNRAVQEDLAQRMAAASENLEFEIAAGLRDRIRALTAIQSTQDINVEGIGDADVIALTREGGETCIQVVFFRASQNYGSRAYFPSHEADAEDSDVMAAFVGQFYSDKPVPRRVYLSHEPSELSLLRDALDTRSTTRVHLLVPKKGDKRRLLNHAALNARDALARRLAESASQRRLLEGLADALELSDVPERIEVYDNSHLGGTQALGAMIVAGPEGFKRSAYRKFNIKNKDLVPGDDYGMMREVLTRRFARAQKEDPDRDRGQWPDLVMIDGGQGQLNTALEVLQELGIDDLPLVAVAKGPDRDAGRERLFRAGASPLSLPPNDPVLFFIQRLRDEAHRFVIGGQRAKRERAIVGSPLDDIPGIGPARKKALLLHFGSGRAVARAGLTDLEAVDGISKSVARKIYDHFHGRPDS